jgi:hypothetical protein
MKVCLNVLQVSRYNTTLGEAYLRMPRFDLHNYNDWAAQVSNNLHSIQENMMGYETKPIRTIDDSTTKSSHTKDFINVKVLIFDRNFPFLEFLSWLMSLTIAYFLPQH